MLVMLTQLLSQSKANLPNGLYNPILEGAAGSDLEGAKSGSLLMGIISGILQFMMLFGTLYMLLQLVMAGLDWIGSGGDSSKLEKARHRLTNAVIGLLVLSASFAIWTVVKDFLGIQLEFGLLMPPGSA
jgi:hypothetical protein